MFLIYLGFLWFLTWFIKTQKIFDYVFRGKFLSELRACPICLGSWIGIALAFVFGVSVFDGLPVLKIIILDQFITGITASMLVYYLSTGIRVIHFVEVIE